jgi:hypothetical protein
MKTELVVVVLAGGVELVRPMDPAPIDDHHDLFLGFPEGCHDLMNVLAQLLGIKVGNDFIEDFRGAILDGADDAEQHAARDATPGTILQPRLAFEAFFAFDLALAQWTGREARTLGFPPPAGTGEGKAPQDGLIFIEQNDLAPASTVLQRSECERGVGKISGPGIEPSGGTTVAYVFFFNTSRTLSRLTCTPVWWAKTVASS